MEQGENMCSTHVESKATFFCSSPSCNKFICAQCVCSTHKDHLTYFVRFVNESARANIAEELENASKKKAKNLETIEKHMGDPKGNVKAELEDIVFNSQYITLLRAKLKEYEKHHQELVEKNKKIAEDSKKNKEESMKESGNYQKELKSSNQQIAELKKQIADDTKKFEFELQKERSEREKDMSDLKSMHRIEMDTLAKEKRELEEELKSLKEYKEHKQKKEEELRQCKDNMDKMRKEFAKERMDIADIHMKKIQSIENQQKADELVEKNKARLLAQKDLAITEETHKRLVEELRDDRKTQKDEIERIKKKEGKLSIF